MHYREMAPSRALAPWVRCFWALEDHLAAGEHATERIVPDGCMEIVFSLGDPLHGLHDGISVKRPDMVVVGEIRRHVLVVAHGSLRLVGVRFHPGGLAPFVNVPATEVVGLFVELDALWGADARTLAEQLHGAASFESAVAMLEARLLARCNPSHADHPIHAAVAAIHRSGGRITARELAQISCLGERQFQRRFARLVGATPKVLSRVVRFQSIFAAIAGDSARPSWARIALDNGYADQAHFINDFREFSGLPPTSFFNDGHTVSDHFTGLATARP
jgi:AraC-like DNA-binding protein